MTTDNEIELCNVIKKYAKLPVCTYECSFVDKECRLSDSPCIINRIAQGLAKEGYGKVANYDTNKFETKKEQILYENWQECESEIKRLESCLGKTKVDCNSLTGDNIETTNVIVSNPEKIREIKTALESNKSSFADIKPSRVEDLPSNAKDIWFNTKLGV